MKEVAFLWHRGLGAHSSRENKMTDPICFRIATVNDKETQQQVSSTCLTCMHLPTFGFRHHYCYIAGAANNQKSEVVIVLCCVVLQVTSMEAA